MITKKISLALPVIFLTAMIITSGCIKRVSTSQLDETGTRSADLASAEAQAGLNGDEFVAVSEPSIPTVDIHEDEYEYDAESALSTTKYKGIKDIYFDFDQYTIRDESKAKLQDNAALIKSKKVKRIIIEGHCDERGTNEYNLALGERRAQSTKRYLTALGVNPANIAIISYGEEKLFCSEKNEDCWQQNRRAHFVLQENGS